MKPNKFDGMRSQISLRRFWFRILRVWVDKLVSSLISSRQLFSFFFFKITFAVFLLVCLFVLVGGSFSSRGWGQGLACAKHMLHYSVISLAILVILILSFYPSEIEARIDSQQWGKVSSFKTVDAGFGHLFLSWNDQVIFVFESIYVTYYSYWLDRPWTISGKKPTWSWWKGFLMGFEFGLLFYWKVLQLYSSVVYRTEIK